MDKFEELMASSDQMGPHDAAYVYYRMHSFRMDMHRRDFWIYHISMIILLPMLIFESGLIGWFAYQGQYGSATVLFLAATLVLFVVNSLHKVYISRKAYLARMEEVEKAMEKILNKIKEENYGKG